MNLITFIKRLIKNTLGIEKKSQPVWLYQMGKVGSTTVYKSITNSAPGLLLQHVHMMNDLDQIEALVKSTRPDPRGTIEAIEQGRKLRHIKNRYWGPHRIITLVREPVGRNVSAFFQNIEEIIPDIFTRAENGTLDFEDLKRRFYDDFATHNAPAQWFQNQMEPVFNIDIFQFPFPWDKGFQIIKTRNVQMLIIRIEDLNRVFGQAIQEFLGISGATIVTDNVGETKDYAEIYKTFKQKNLISPDYIDSQYHTLYATHFYSPAEITAYRIKWQ